MVWLVRVADTARPLTSLRVAITSEDQRPRCATTTRATCGPHLPWGLCRRRPHVQADSHCKVFLGVPAPTSIRDGVAPLPLLVLPLPTGLNAAIGQSVVLNCVDQYGGVPCCVLLCCVALSGAVLKCAEMREEEGGTATCVRGVGVVWSSHAACTPEPDS